MHLLNEFPLTSCVLPGVAPSSRWSASVQVQSLSEGSPCPVRQQMHMCSVRVCPQNHFLWKKKSPCVLLEPRVWLIRNNLFSLEKQFGIGCDHGKSELPPNSCSGAECRGLLRRWHLLARGAAAGGFSSAENLLLYIPSSCLPAPALDGRGGMTLRATGHL